MLLLVQLFLLSMHCVFQWYKLQFYTWQKSFRRGRLPYGKSKLSLPHYIYYINGLLQFAIHLGAGFWKMVRGSSVMRAFVGKKFLGLS